MPISHISEKEKSIIGTLFGTYTNLALDLNKTIETYTSYPRSFQNVDERLRRTMKHIRNLETLAQDLGYTIAFVDHYRIYDKITGIVLSYGNITIIKLNLITGELVIDPRLI